VRRPFAVVESIQPRVQLTVHSFPILKALFVLETRVVSSWLAELCHTALQSELSLIRETSQKEMHAQSLLVESLFQLLVPVPQKSVLVLDKPALHCLQAL
jgi:hypothetical protein